MTDLDSLRHREQGLQKWIAAHQAKIDNGLFWFNETQNISNAAAINCVEKEVNRIRRIINLRDFNSINPRKVFGGRKSHRSR
tara:strand:- start:1042 stop:1287 length:246 start_codon:yes stop_codon:yes gene_type:complete